MEKSLIEDLGAEITAIVTPVSICMLLVVLMVHGLNPHGSEGGGPAIGALVYQEHSTDTTEEKLGGALLNALVFIIAIAAVTFILVLLFYCRCMRFLWCYMGFSGFMILSWLGGYVFVKAIDIFNIPMDIITFAIILYNFSVVGMAAIFSSRMPIFLTQMYLVLIGALVAFWFTHLPEWTTWLLLVAMAVYDLAAVLLPGGPLKVLVEMAIERDEDLPVLIYEARPQSLANSAGGGASTRGMQPLPTQSPPRGQSSSSSHSNQPSRRRWAGRRGARGGGRDPDSGVASVAASEALSAQPDSQVSDEAALLPPIAALSSVGIAMDDNGSATDVLPSAGVAGALLQQMPPVAVMTANGPGAGVGGGNEFGTENGLHSAGNGPGASEPSSPVSPSEADEGQPLVRHTSSSARAGGVDGIGLRDQVHSGLERERERERTREEEQRMVDHHHHHHHDHYQSERRLSCHSHGDGDNGNEEEQFGLPDAIKLGLGDFIFYSVLVGRAAMYDLMTVYACYLAIMAGLGATLVLLAVYRKALPALPFSIALGVMFYFLTRLVMDPFVVGLATRLLFF